MSFKAVCKRKGRGKTHATDFNDYRRTVCGKSCDGFVLSDDVPDCKSCLRVLLEIETNGN